MSAKQDIYSPLKHRAFNLLQSISIEVEESPIRAFLGKT